MGGLTLIIAFAACTQPTQTPSPEAQAVASAKAGLAITFSSGDSAESVTGNLTLPTTATGDVAVSWASSNTAVISVSGATATVMRPAVGLADANVTLMATLTKGEAKDTKAFGLTVPANGKVASFTGSHDWTSFTTGVTAPAVYCVTRSGNSIYAGTQNKGLLYSDDLGATWNVKNAANDNLADDQIYSIAVSGNLVFIGTYSGFSVWDRSSSPGSITKHLSGTKITDIAVSGSTIYMAASDGLRTCTTSDFTTVLYPAGFAHPNKLFIAGGTLYATGDSDSTNTQELDAWVIGPSLAARTMIDVVNGPARTVGPVFVNGSSIVVAVDFCLYYRGSDTSKFEANYATGGGTLMGFGYTGTYLLAVKCGGDLWYSSDAGAHWSSVTVPGHDGFSGIVANGILCDGSTVFIAYNGGIVMGTFE